ncbi:MAG: DUF4097 family beta strand repeat-containing protein [Bacteroidota bacterium]
MKTLITTIALFGIFFLAHGQTYEMTPSGNSSELTINIENLFAYIDVRGTSEGSIRIEADDYRGLPEKAKGLKPLSATGPDNTEIGLYVKQVGNTVSIAGAHRSADDADYTIFLPKNAKLRIDYNSFQANHVKVSDMASEVEIDSKVGDIELVNVTGPIVANSLSSDIDVDFSSVTQGSPTSISSTSGDLDITLPADTKGNFNMKSISGEVYTDLDFEMEQEEGSMRRFGGGMSAEATLNGGGVDISLRCISGDIYIRKK